MICWGTEGVTSNLCQIEHVVTFVNGHVLLGFVDLDHLHEDYSVLVVSWGMKSVAETNINSEEISGNKITTSFLRRF